MRSWSNLPVELLECFFQYVQERSSLFECQRICKKWSQPAQAAVYKNVQINSFEQLKSFAETMEKASSSNEEGGAYELVETISTLIANGLHNTFGDTDHNYYISDYFPKVLRYCTNLKSIQMTNFRLILNLYQAICKERARGGLLYLESIPYPLDDGDDWYFEEEALRWYVKAVWSLRNNIKQVWMRDDLDIYYLSDYEEDDINHFIGLDYYTQMTHLDFTIIERDTTLFKVFSSCQQCKSLTSLSIDSRRSKYASLDTAPSSKYAMDITYPNIKTLKIKNATCQDQLIQYLIHAFTKLECLHIDFESKEEILDTIALEEMLLSTDACLDFLKYLYKKVKKYYINNILVRDTMAIANKFLESVNFTGYLSLEYYVDQGDLVKPAITAMDCNVDDMCLVLFFEDTGVNYTIQLPHQYLVHRFGHSLKELYISFTMTPDQESNNHYDHLHGHLFDFIFKHCQALKTLHLCNLTLEHCDPAKIIVNDHIEEIVLEKCDFRQDGSIFTELSERLPKLNSLDLIYNTYGADNRRMKFIMTHTSFKKLTWTSLPESEPAYKNCYIKLTINGSTMPLYYIANRKNFRMKKVTDCPRFDNQYPPKEDEMVIEVECKSIELFGLDTDWRVYNLKFVQECRDNNAEVKGRVLSNALTKEVTIYQNYSNGKELFKYLQEHLAERENRHDVKDIEAFQKAVTTLVRYASSISKARYYFCLVLDKYKNPLRTSTLELLLFTQFLKVNINATNENGHIYGALEVVKLALEIGIYNVDYPKQVFHNKYEEHPLQIFERVIKKVLDYFKLEYNQDETDLVPVTRKRFSR